MSKEALKELLETVEAAIQAGDWKVDGACDPDSVIRRSKEALAQTQPRYDKTEMNCFVQDLYDKKMKEGKHGHYETMFHVVHQAIKRVPPQRNPLTDEEILTVARDHYNPHQRPEISFARAIEAAHGIKENK